MEGIMGRVVETAWYSVDQLHLAIQFADGDVALFTTDGDCCATAWIEHAEAFDFKGPLLRVESSGVDRPPALQADYDVLDQEQFIMFATERGRLIVDLRTSHNGYYGGLLTFGGNLPNLPPGDWMEVSWLSAARHQRPRMECDA